MFIECIGEVHNHIKYKIKWHIRIYKDNNKTEESKE